jgi:four helix bundle protein
MGNGKEEAVSGERPRVGLRDEAMRERTKQFALRVIRVFRALPRTREAEILGHQMLRSGTSVAANYAEASRARSRKELIFKLGLVEQELAETITWFELLTDSSILPAARMAPIHQEGEDLLKIVVASIRTLKHGRRPKG